MDIHELMQQAYSARFDSLTELQRDIFRQSIATWENLQVGWYSDYGETGEVTMDTVILDISFSAYKIFIKFRSDQMEVAAKLNKGSAAIIVMKVTGIGPHQLHSWRSVHGDLIDIIFN